MKLIQGALMETNDDNNLDPDLSKQIAPESTNSNVEEIQALESNQSNSDETELKPKKPKRNVGGVFSSRIKPKPELVESESVKDVDSQTDLDMATELNIDVKSSDSQEIEVSKTNIELTEALNGSAETPDMGDEEDEAVAESTSEEDGKVEEVFEYLDNEVLELLKPGRIAPADDEETEEMSRLLDRLFVQFDIVASVSGFKRGPRITRYEVTMGKGVRVDKISRLKDEIRLATAAERVNILTPVPGTNVVGIEMPRRFPDIVSLGDVLRTRAAHENKSPTLIAVGQDVDGAPVLADIATMPHLLVAGATGSGKSSFINALICSLLTRATPDDVRLILIDPKRVELTLYSGIPHLALPVIHESADAGAALQWAIEEMEARYKLLENFRVNRIDKFNDTVLKKNLHGTKFNGRIVGKLPRIIIIVDELADLMKTSTENIEAMVVRLTQLGRAAGIHVVVATQRPSVDVITGLIKANIPSRLAFATASQVDSRVILDTVGAETLTGSGDGLLSLTGISAPIRVQGALVDEEEIESIVEYACNIGELPESLSPWIKPITDVDIKVQTQSNIHGKPSNNQLEGNSSNEASVLEESSDSIVDADRSEDSLHGEKSGPQVMQFEDWVEPHWRDELELTNKRIEPCDLTGVIVETSRKRVLFRTIDWAMARIKLRLTNRLKTRSEYRFKDRIDEDNAVRDALTSLEIWKEPRAKSVAWLFHEEATAEAKNATAARDEAVEYVGRRFDFRNPKANQVFGDFVKSLVVVPIISIYIFSVLILTANKFDFFLKYFPPFNLGRWPLLAIVLAFWGFAWLRAAWKYSTEVRESQDRYVAKRKDYETKKATIEYASLHSARLEQQLAGIEPLLRVLAVGYRSSWISDENLNFSVSTSIDTSKLPACVAVSRAVEGEDDVMRHLRDLALRQVIAPGWRTSNLETLGKLYALREGRPASSMRLSSLDGDLGESMSGARKLFLAAASDEDLRRKLGVEKLRSTIETLHKDVLRMPDSEHRPPVLPLRENGFENIDTSSEWLDKSLQTQPWLDFLGEILKGAAPFGKFNLSSAGKFSALNNRVVHSAAVLPKYLTNELDPSIKPIWIEGSQVSPIDVVVRVDVSDWAEPVFFKVFELDEQAQTDKFHEDAALADYAETPDVDPSEFKEETGA
jgi:DNA segregation ATPase FtsK/SpoIIIE-like protein